MSKVVKRYDGHSKTRGSAVERFFSVLLIGSVPNQV